MSSTRWTETHDLGATGIALDLDEGHQQHAREYECLGFGALWISGGQLTSLDPLTDVLGATSDVVVAPSIASLDVHSVGSLGDVYATAERLAPGRLVLGLGGPQRLRVGALQAMRDAVDALDEATPPVPPSRRLLAALGPRKLDLAQERFAGAITLLVTPDHTRATRRVLGDATLVVNQMAVLETDAERARAAARGPLSFLATVGGYAANFRRMGFTDADIEGLSDRLVDAVVAWGDAEQIVHRFAQQRAAGADHLVLSLLPSEGGPSIPDAARRLAPSLVG